MKKKSISMKTFVVSLCGTAIISGGVVFGAQKVYTQYQAAQTNQSLYANDELGKVHALYDLLGTQYYKKVDHEKLIDGALKGMTTALGDPYSTYLEKSDAEDLSESLSDSFEGIGATLSIVDTVPQLAQAPIKDTPAEKAGLKAGDQILSVDGDSTNGKTLQEIVKKVRGQKGTSVKLELQRASEKFSVTIVRDKIPLYSVIGDIDATHTTVGKIQITSFSENTYEELKKEIVDLRKKGATSFVIDLRQNPGGLLNQVSSMASMFLENGKPIYQLESRDGKYEKMLASKELDGGFKVKEPTVVLIDSGSASASEIFAGAVNESADIPLVGTKSFGKGTVQTVTRYSDGSEVKLTIKKWLTPNKEWIHEKGLQPTYPIEYPEFVHATPIDSEEAYHLGVSSDAVKNLNTFLAGIGYPTSGNEYNETTKDAVLDFQSKHGLSVTGEVDKNTAASVMKEATDYLRANDAMYNKALDLLKP